MDPYRKIEANCDLCNTAIEAQKLTEFFSVMVCPACTSGQNDEALERMGFITKISDTRYRNDYRHHVEVSQQTALSIVVNFNREELGGKLLGLFGKGDHKVGHKDFDQYVNIEVDEDYLPILDTILEREPVRSAIIHLLESGRDNQVQMINSITSARWVAEGLSEPPDTKRFNLMTLVLACLMRRVDKELKISQR